MKKFEIYLVDLNPVIGSEQSGIRPCLVIQNDISNDNSPVTIISAITSKIKKAGLLNILIKKESNILPKDSIIMLNQIRTIDKKRLIKYLGGITDERIKEKINQGLKISLDL